MSHRSAAAASEPDLGPTLRAVGLRATPARAAVLAVLRGAGRPMSHAEVAERLTHGSWDRATLYRNLIDLTKVGLVQRLDWGDHIWRFELRQPAHGAADHPHFLCTACGKVACVPHVRLVTSPRTAPSDWLGPDVEVQLKGRCGDCR